MLLLTKKSIVPIEPLAKSAGEISHGFTKVKIMTYKSNTNAINLTPYT